MRPRTSVRRAAIPSPCQPERRRRAGRRRPTSRPGQPARSTASGLSAACRRSGVPPRHGPRDSGCAMLPGPRLAFRPRLGGVGGRRAGGQGARDRRRKARNRPCGPVWSGPCVAPSTQRRRRLACCTLLHSRPPPRRLRLSRRGGRHRAAFQPRHPRPRRPLRRLAFPALTDAPRAVRG